MEKDIKDLFFRSISFFLFFFRHLFILSLSFIFYFLSVLFAKNVSRRNKEKKA